MNTKKILNFFPFSSCLFLISFFESISRAEAQGQGPEKKSLTMIFTSSRQLDDFIVQAKVLCFESVLKATQLQGKRARKGDLVKTGILTELNHHQKFRYTSHDTEKLQVIFLDGNEWSLALEKLEGTLHEGTEIFFLSDHELQFWVDLPKVFKGQIFSQLKKNKLKIKINGKFFFDEIPYEVDLKEEGEMESQLVANGSGGMQSTLSYEGVITKDDFLLEIREISFEGQVIEGTWSRVDSLRVMNNSLRLGKVLYSLAQGKLKIDLKDDQAYKPEYWAVEGLLLQDGKPYGALELREENENGVRKKVLWLRINQGPGFKVQSWDLAK